jgi:hypothetical protein
VHQAKYTKDILKKFQMDDSKPLSTLMSTTVLDEDEDGCHTLKFPISGCE